MLHTDHSIFCSICLDSPRETSQELQLSQRTASRTSQPGAFSCCPASNKVVGTSNECMNVPMSLPSVFLILSSEITTLLTEKKKKKQNQPKKKREKKTKETPNKQTKTSQNFPLSPDFNWWIFSLYLPLWYMSTDTPLTFLNSGEKLKVISTIIHFFYDMTLMCKSFVSSYPDIHTSWNT